MGVVEVSAQYEESSEVFRHLGCSVSNEWHVSLPNYNFNNGLKERAVSKFSHTFYEKF